MRGFGGVVLLFAMGALALFAGLVPLWERIEWSIGGRDAVMVLEEPTIRPRGLVPGGYDVHFVEVKYLLADGSVVHVPQKRLDLATALRLADGARIPVRFLKKNPDRALMNDETLDNPYGWLAVGLALLATGAFANRLYRRERG